MVGCPGDSNKSFVTGAAMAITGNLLISVSFQLQKYAHNRNEELGLNTPYVKIPLWWVGLLCMAGGEVGNFIAYGYAPATLVAPLGAVSVISNAVLARLILKESLMRNNIIGVFLALCGSVMIVLSAPESCATITQDILIRDLKSGGFIAFIIFVVIGVVALLRVPERLMKRYVIFDVAICGLMGSITVMSAKGVSTGLRDSFVGHGSWFTHPLIYILIISAASSIVLQMRYLNRAMMQFGTTEVVPVYYVVFNVCAIAAGMALYHEYKFQSKGYIAVFVLGAIVTFGGVFLINLRKRRASGLLSQIDDGTEVLSPGQAPGETSNANDYVSMS